MKLKFLFLLMAAALVMGFAACSEDDDDEVVPNIDLSTVTSDLTLQNGDVVTGNLKENVKISIADGATVTFKGDTIKGAIVMAVPRPGITCRGDATIILADGTVNVVSPFGDYYPGIYVPLGKTLIIRGNTGELRVRGSHAAAIGGGSSSIGAFGETIYNDNVNSPKIKKMQLWSPDTPKRYDVELILEGDTLRDAIGFRTIATRGKQILLNGKPIFLRGISIHEEKAYGGGRANSADDARTLLTWAKELGCNFVRLAHYPHNEYAVREAERMGILVWSEIPVYWTIDWTNPDTYANAEQQLTDMIRRDQNRANVIIWSIANETPHSTERDMFLSRLAQKARSMDDTRLISMAMEVTSASNYKNRLQDNMNQWVDIISFNQYIGWYRDVNDAPKMEWEIPYDKPVIVSEFGGGAKYGMHGDKNQRWTEEFQENLYRENTAMLDKIDGLSGTTPWILKDFRSPRRVLNGIQDYYNRKGLVSDNGEKKKAFFVLKEWYAGK